MKAKNFFRSTLLLALILFTFTLGGSFFDFFPWARSQQIEPIVLKTESKVIQNSNCTSKTAFFDSNNLIQQKIKEDNQDFKKICKSSSDTPCCTNEDKKALFHWLKDEQISEPFSDDSETRYAMRTRKQNQILAYTLTILNNLERYQKIAENISQNTKTKCYDSAKYLIEADPEGLENYFKVNQKCMKSQLKLQEEFICGMCEKQDDQAKDNSYSCKSLEDNCKEAIKLNLEKVFPQLNAIEQVIRCKSNGSIIETLPPAKELPLADFDIGMIIENFSSFCPRFMSIGSDTNKIIEGSEEFVLSIYLNSQEVFGDDSGYNVENHIEVKSFSKKKSRERNLSSDTSEKDDEKNAEGKIEYWGAIKNNFFRRNLQDINDVIKDTNAFKIHKYKPKKKPVCAANVALQQEKLAIMRAKEKCARIERAEKAKKAAIAAKKKRDKELRIAKQKARAADRLRKFRLKKAREAERKAKDAMAKERRKREFVTRAGNCRWSSYSYILEDLYILIKIN